MCLRSSTNRDFVTVREAISGDGTVLPPMVILSGVFHQLKWYTSTNIPDDTLIPENRIATLRPRNCSLSNYAKHRIPQLRVQVHPGPQKSQPEFPPYTTHYPVFKAPNDFIGGGYCGSIAYYSTEAQKVLAWQPCTSTAWCAGPTRSRTHTSSSESTRCKTARWKTYLRGPGSCWSALCRGGT